jgi:hypothetical protein
MRLLIVLMLASSSAFATDNFTSEAAQLALRLKTSLMSELQLQIAKTGHEAAIDFFASSM